MRQVDFSIDGHAILRDINLQTTARRVGIVGRNGSGKSTLSRLLAGLIKPSKGSIEVCGLDVYQDRKAALSTVGILFQNPDHQIIFPTVEEEIAFGLLQQGQSKAQAGEAVEAILNKFGKAHWAKQAVHALSQGQKRLVCLLAVLAMGPKIIILDEPFSGLDIPTQMQLARTLAHIDAMSVHIAHDPAQLRDCGHLIWMEQGRIEGDGAADDVLPAFEARMREIGGGDDISHLTG